MNRTQKLTTLLGAITETITYVYDERGRLKTSTVVKTGDTTVVAGYKFDDSRIRVSQTIDSTTTLYLIDAQNPTGYTQVLEEGNTGANANLEPYRRAWQNIRDRHGRRHAGERRASLASLVRRPRQHAGASQWLSASCRGRRRPKGLELRRLWPAAELLDNAAHQPSL